MSAGVRTAVIGSGPFGLAVGAHLRGAGARVFGEPMRTWRTVMPAEMVLRSDWEDSSIASPGGVGHIDRWLDAVGETREGRVSLETFLRYADWYRSTLVPDHDPAQVVRVEADGSGYRLWTDAGDELAAEHLVLAVGALAFAHAPEPFAGALEGDRIGYAIDHADRSSAGERVAIVGAGQSALEAAASLSRRGVSVELIVRGRVHWFADREPDRDRGPLTERLYRLAYPVVGFGPPGLNRLIRRPDLFALLPWAARKPLHRRLLRPGGAPWLRDEVEAQVSISEGRTVRDVRSDGAGLRLELDDGSVREVDRVLLATGFRFDKERLDLLAPELRACLAVDRGWPVIDRWFRAPGRSSMLLVGYPAEGRFGPGSRFVRGTRFAAPRVAEALAA